MFFAGEFTYGFSNILIKLSVLAFYLRIFTDQKFKRSTYVLVGILIAFWLVILIKNTRYEPFAHQHVRWITKCYSRRWGEQFLRALLMSEDDIMKAS